MIKFQISYWQLIEQIGEKIHGFVNRFLGNTKHLINHTLHINELAFILVKFITDNQGKNESTNMTEVSKTLNYFWKGTKKESIRQKKCWKKSVGLSRF